MLEVIELEELAQPLVKPYVVTRSKLGSTTKVIEEKFICTPKELRILFRSVGEKISGFQPNKAGFQYLVSFTDSTHYENSDLDSIEENISSSNKKTEKLILNWKIAHQYGDVENEMSITVRISNPMNPIVMLQAAMSHDHSDADILDFEDGSVSVSVHGATQNTAEEIFSIVQRWAEACPQPQSITGINNTIYKHFEKVEFVNYWIFPALFTFCAFFYLKDLSIEKVVPYSFAAFAAFMYIRNATHHVNRRIGEWARKSRVFSLFSLTGGDQNQQTKMAARSKNHTIKLLGSVFLSFVVNLAAGIVVALYISS